eukprot:Gb_07864 [translate_table: standard]
MATRSFWVTKANEDHLGHYTQEWQQLSAVNENGQHNPGYLALRQAKVFRDKITLVDGELITKITRVPMDGTTVNLKEEAKRAKKEWVIQKLYPGCAKEEGCRKYQLPAEKGRKNLTKGPPIKTHQKRSPIPESLNHQNVSARDPNPWLKVIPLIPGRTIIQRKQIKANRKNRKQVKLKGRRHRINQKKDSSIPPSIYTSNNPESTNTSSAPNTSQNVITTMPMHVSPLTVVSPTCPQPVVTEIPLTQWCQTLFEMDPSLESSLAIAPHYPTETQELTTKVEELEVELILQANQAQTEHASLNEKISLLLAKIGKLDALPSEEQSTLAFEVPTNIWPHIHLLRQKAMILKEPSPPPSLETELSYLRTGSSQLREKCYVLEKSLKEKENHIEELYSEIE